mgnify:CR=1 FL=1
MKKVEEIIIVRGHDIADMPKNELDKYIQKIYEVFIADGAVEWESEPIFTKALLLDHIERFNKDRLDHGYTSLTPKDIDAIKSKLFEPKSVVPTNELEILEKAIDITYDRISEDIARLKIQMRLLKEKAITLTEESVKIEKGGE